MFIQIILFLMVGLFAGWIAGLFGIGGGVIYVPLQIIIYDFLGMPRNLQMKISIGTSLAAIALSSLLAVRTHAKHKAILYRVVWIVSSGIVLGVILGSYLAIIAPSKLLEIIFGIIECVFAVFFFLMPEWQERQEHHHAHLWFLSFIGFGIGILATLLGVGGGFFALPILMFYRISMQKAIGSSSLIATIAAFAAVICFLLPVIREKGSYPYTYGYLYIPAFLAMAIGSMISIGSGARMAHTLPTHLLKKGFAFLLLIAGIFMIVR